MPEGSSSAAPVIKPGPNSEQNLRTTADRGRLTVRFLHLLHHWPDSCGLAPAIAPGGAGTSNGTARAFWSLNGRTRCCSCGSPKERAVVGRRGGGAFGGLAEARGRRGPVRHRIARAVRH